MWQAVKAMSISVAAGTAVLLACLVLLTNESKAGGGVLCVVPPGEPTGPFAACAAVFTQIQDAVDTAVGGEEIWVAAGVYTVVHTVPAHGWTQQIVFVTKTVTIRGGYVAPFSEPPDFQLNLTVLDAQRQGQALYVSGASDVVIQGLHLTGGAGSAVMVIGFGETSATLSQNVIYDNIGFTDEGGGGIVVNNSSIVLDQNIIRHNVGTISGTGTYEDVAGGGVYLRNSRAALTGNHIISNTAVLSLAGGFAYGGGLYAQNSHITLTNNIISGNVTAVTYTGDDHYLDGAFGGGIAIENSILNIISNTIVGNIALGTDHLTTIKPTLTSGLGGGLSVRDSQGLISHNVFAGNYAVAGYAGYGEGGGLAVSGPALTITHNTIEANTACVHCFVAWGGGVSVGARYDVTSTIHLADNAILHNTGVISGAGGIGGGVIVRGNRIKPIILRNNWVMSNTAAMTTSLYFGLGGGLYVYGGTVESYNSRFLHNTAVHHGLGYGGGFAIGGYEQVNMVNTILNDNQAATNGSAVAMIGEGSTLAMYHSTLAQNQGSGESAVWVADYNIETGGPIANSRLMMTNTILVSHTTAVSVGNGHTAVLNGVLWFNTPVTVTAGPTATVNVSHQLTGDPAFAPDGYHLMAGSAAIRAGVPSGVSLDIDGEGRPSANPSLGADEYWPFKRYFPVVFRE